MIAKKLKFYKVDLYYNLVILKRTTLHVMATNEEFAHMQADARMKGLSYRDIAYDPVGEPDNFQATSVSATITELQPVVNAMQAPLTKTQAQIVARLYALRSRGITLDTRAKNISGGSKWKYSIPIRCSSGSVSSDIFDRTVLSMVEKGLLIPVAKMDLDEWEVQVSLGTTKAGRASMALNVDDPRVKEVAAKVDKMLQNPKLRKCKWFNQDDLKALTSGKK